MSRRRRIEITVENRLLVLRRAVHPSVWCAVCPVPVQMLTPEEAAALTQVSTRWLYRQLEAGQIHFVETPEGRLNWSRARGEIGGRATPMTIFATTI